MNNFTPRAQQVLALSRREAEVLHHNVVSPEHLLLGMFRLEKGVAINLLKNSGLDFEATRNEVVAEIGSKAEKQLGASSPYSARSKKVLALACKEAKALEDCYVGTQHILLGLLREGDGVASHLLRTHGLDIEQIRVEAFDTTRDDTGYLSQPVPIAKLSGSVNHTKRCQFITFAVMSSVVCFYLILIAWLRLVVSPATH